MALFKPMGSAISPAPEPFPRIREPRTGQPIENTPQPNEKQFMEVHELDPLRDPRWSGLVESHPRASVFS